MRGKAVSAIERLAMAARRGRLSLASVGRAAQGNLVGPALLRLFGSPRSTRILFVPQDLRTADPVRAHDIAGGYFVFAGRAVDRAASPFEVAPPSEEWLTEAASFSWLRHLRASGTADDGAAARAFVVSFLDHAGFGHPIASRPRVAAERLRAWLSASGLLVRGADDVFYRRFTRALDWQARMLEARSFAAEPGIDRLAIATALVTAGLCLDEHSGLLRRATQRLERELSAQILPDGGHVGRDPGAAVELALDLLPLRQLFPARDMAPPKALLVSIDRLLPMIRFMRHADGSLARFNGMGPTPIDRIATVLAYDESRGAPSASAPHSGYERIEAGPTVLLVDVGGPPPPAFSRQAHAGALSFELSSGRSIIVMNCGTSGSQRALWKPEARKTAAHSTVTVAESSSCRFALSGVAAGAVLAGPRNVSVDRRGQALTAVHDGYRARFQVIHARTLALSADGARLDGEDILDGGGVPFVLRFHLHPSAQVFQTETGHGALVVLPNREAWAFGADLPVRIEESIALALPEGPRRSLQLVVEAHSSENRRVVWTFRRMERAASVQDRAEALELPLAGEAGRTEAEESI